jgi:hypothetical protein
MRSKLLVAAIVAAGPATTAIAQNLPGRHAGMMGIEPYPSLPKSGTIQFTLPDGIVLLDYRDGRIAMIAPIGARVAASSLGTVVEMSGVYCFYSPSEGAYRQPFDVSGSAARETRFDPAAMQVLAQQIKEETDGWGAADLIVGALRPVSPRLDEAVKSATESGCKIEQSPLTPGPAP